MKQFLRELSRKILSNVSDHNQFNWDEHRFGKQPQESFSSKVRRQISAGLKVVKYWLNGTGFVYFQSNDNGEDGLKYFASLYDKLTTNEDKELLITLLAYRILGPKKVLLPLNTPEYWSKLKQVEKLEDKTISLDSGFLNLKLNLTDLHPIGFPIKLFFSPAGIMADYVVEQYRYKKESHLIAVEPGDVVLDGGGCFGDTALYFANATGVNGHVFSFEFIPSNMAIWKKNLSLNPQLEKQCSLIEAPLWSESNQDVHYISNGPASVVSFTPLPNEDGKTKTITVDDFVASRKIDRLDFVKLDIEGAELNALRGATQSLKKFKPKLAVALYHNGRDFQEIPEFIEKLGCGYRFYLNHSTIHQEETILFATAR
jgi:FkbM family methyltransferase